MSNPFFYLDEPIIGPCNLRCRARNDANVATFTTGTVNLQSQTNAAATPSAGMTAGVTITGFQPTDTVRVTMPGGGTYIAYSPWGIPAYTGSNNTGSANMFSVVPDAVTANKFDVGDPLIVSGGGHHGYNGYAAAQAAFGTHTFSGASSYTFYIEDTVLISDNTGGLSIFVENLGFVLNPGDAVDLSWWQTTFEQGVNDEARMGIDFFDAAGVVIGTSVFATYDRPQPWTQRFLSTTVPTDAASIRLYMEMLRHTGTNNDGYIDDIHLTIGGVAIPITNYNAETGDTSGWTSSIGQLTTRAASPAPTEGLYYFMGSTNGTAHTLAYQDIPNTGSTYLMMGVTESDPNGFGSNVGGPSNFYVGMFQGPLSDITGSAATVGVYVSQSNTWLTTSVAAATPNPFFEISFNGETFDYYANNSLVHSWATTTVNPHHAIFKIYAPGVQIYDVRWYRGSRTGGDIAKELRFYGSVEGNPAPDQELFFLDMEGDETFAAGFPDNLGKCQVAPTASLSFPVKKNGTTVGSMNIAAAATTATWTLASDLTFVAGDTLGFYAPSTYDTTLSDVSFTFVGSITS